MIVLVAGVTLAAAAASAAPQVTIGDAKVVEGKLGTKELVFTISVDDLSGTGSRHQALADPIVVDYQTADITASAAQGDYIPVSGSVVFHSIPASAVVSVLVNGDKLYELDETLTVEAVSVENAPPQKPRGIGTVLNDDTPPLISIGDASAVEGDLGTTGMPFEVTLSGVSGVDTEVDFFTEDGTAWSGAGDYRASAGHLTIPAGELSGRIVIEANGEVAYEPAESFHVFIANPIHANIDRGRAVGTIQNDDVNLAANMVANPTFLTGIAGWVPVGSAGVYRKTDGLSNCGPHSAEIVGAFGSTAEFGIHEHPCSVEETPSVGTRYRVTAWVWGDDAHGAAEIRVNEMLDGTNIQTTESPAVELSTEWKKLTFDVVSKSAGSEFEVMVMNRPTTGGEGFHVDEVSIQRVQSGDIPPELAVPGMLSIRPDARISLDVTAADIDGQNIDALTADLSDFPAGNLPVFVVNATKTGGRLQWTPRVADLRAEPYQVRFTAMNTSAATGTARLQVMETPPNIANNGGFESHLGGWQPYAGSVMARVPAGMQGAWAAEITGSQDQGENPFAPRGYAIRWPLDPATEFGIESSTPAVPMVASAGTAYDFVAWVRTNDNCGTAYMQVIEQAGSGFVGETSSPSVALGPNWTPLKVRRVASTAGASLSLRIVTRPDSRIDRDPGLRTFQVDAVAIQIAGQGPPAEDGGGGRKDTRAAGNNLDGARAIVQPNPARGEVTLSVTLAQPGPLHLALYDVLGREVRTLATGEFFPAGMHSFAIGGGKAPAKLDEGVYFYRMRSAVGESRGRFVVIK